MESKNLKRDLIILLVSSFIVIICWIGFNIYSKAVTSTIDASLTKQTLPIEPAFDMTTINNLVEREKVAPLYQSEGLPTPSPEIEEPTPTPTTSGRSTAGTGDTLLESVTPVATGGAILP